MRLNLVFFPVALGWFFSSAASVPKIEVGGRVVDLFNGEHFDDVLMDTPVSGDYPDIPIALISSNALRTPSAQAGS
eukprot:697213-Amorphochlora_amoeboformis.AAC.1